MARRKGNNYSWQRYRIENQATQPLALGNLPFRVYLSAHSLSFWDVAQTSGVLYLTTWNIGQNKPIRVEHAARVRAGLFRMTGIVYTGPIVVYPDTHPLYQQPAMHRRRYHETT